MLLVPQQSDNFTADEIDSNIILKIKKAAKEALGTRKLPKSSKYWWNDEPEE